MKALGYVRTSKEDKEKSLSPEAQADDIRSFCKRNAWDLIGILEDRGKSGFTLEGRVEFQKALTMASEGQYDYLVVKRLDRFSRNLRDQTEVCYGFGNLGVVVVSAEQGEFDYRESEKELTGGFFGLFAQYEWRVIRDRFHRGKQKHTRETGNPCTSKFPWGYRYDRQQKQWIIEEEKRDVLIDIAERYANGDSLIDLSTENAHQCVFRGNRPPVPEHSVHLFRG
jgi:site-specific DNA recombinase